MFQGTYTSEFYRKIRDLLHEQVLLQSPERTSSGMKHRKAVRLLQRRWLELLSQEQRYRSEPNRATAARQGTGSAAGPLQGAVGS
jgi:anaerobic magnesium-protoporphyrin IX monomethyl ester cyclase